MRELRGLQGVVIDAACDQLNLDADDPRHQKTIRRFVALVLPHARRAAIAAPDDRYSEAFAKAKRKGEEALAREPSAKAVFRRFCDGVSGTMWNGPPSRHPHEDDDDADPAGEEVG